MMRIHWVPIGYPTGKAMPTTQQPSSARLEEMPANATKPAAGREGATGFGFHFGIIGTISAANMFGNCGFCHRFTYCLTWFKWYKYGRITLYNWP